MFLQVVFGLAAASFLFAAEANAVCFDFSSSIERPLHAVPAYVSHELLVKESGAKPDGEVWALVRGEGEVPISTLLAKLLDHNTTKSSRVSSMEVTELPDPHFLRKQKVSFEVTPFPFIHITWTEEWGYNVIQGSLENPEAVLISYEKIEGTSHIQHLCGNFLLKKLTEKSSDIFLYEEAKATQRTEKDTLNGLVGTFAKLKANKD